MTGSCKSTLARALSERTGVPTINSDIVRKALAGKSGRQPGPYNEGIYSATLTKKTYAKMARMADKLLAEKRAVISTRLLCAEQSMKSPSVWPGNMKSRYC